MVPSETHNGVKDLVTKVFTEKKEKKKNGFPIKELKGRESTQGVSRATTSSRKDTRAHATWAFKLTKSDAFLAGND